MKFCSHCGNRMMIDSTGEFVCHSCDSNSNKASDHWRPKHASLGIVDDKRKVAGAGSELSITEDDIFLLPRVRRMIKREVHYFHQVFKYAQDRYDEECQESANECPDNFNFEEEELRYKQIYTWFVCEKVLEPLGKTILEDYVEKFVARKDPEIAKQMLLAGKNVIRGFFKILDTDHYPYILVEHLESAQRYLALSKMNWAQAKNFYVKGEIITGKIHLWWRDRYYMFDGILSNKQTNEGATRQLGLITPSMMRAIMGGMEQDQVGRYETILVNQNTTLQSAMNKYPSQWVGAMCSAVGINIKAVRIKSDKARAVVSKLESGYAEELLRSNKKLGGKCIAALELLSENDWVVRYGRLTKRFSSETGFWWNSHPPRSELGVLRLHGFLVVGKMPESGRLYKVAIVPLELRAAIKRFLSSSPNSRDNISETLEKINLKILPSVVKDYILENILPSTAMTPDEAIKALFFQFNHSYDFGSLFLTFRTIAGEKRAEIEREAMDSITEKDDMMWYVISDPKGKFGLVVDAGTDRIIHISNEETNLLQLLNKGISLVRTKPKHLFVLGQQETEVLQNVIGSSDVVDVEMLPNAIKEAGGNELANAVMFITARVQSIRDYIYDFVTLWETQMKERKFTDTAWLPYLAAHYYNIDGPNDDAMKRFGTFVYDLLMFQDLLTGEHSYRHAGETLKWDDFENVNRWFQGIQTKIEKHQALPKLMKDGELPGDGSLGSIIRPIGPPYSAKDSINRYWFAGIGTQIDYDNDYLPALGEKSNDTSVKQEEKDAEMTFFVGIAVGKDKETAIQNALSNARGVLDEARKVNAANEAKWLVTTFDTKLFEKHARILGEGIKVKYAPPG